MQAYITTRLVPVTVLVAQDSRGADMLSRSTLELSSGFATVNQMDDREALKLCMNCKSSIYRTCEVQNASCTVSVSTRQCSRKGPKLLLFRNRQSRLAGVVHPSVGTQAEIGSVSDTNSRKFDSLTQSFGLQWTASESKHASLKCRGSLALRLLI